MKSIAIIILVGSFLNQFVANAKGTHKVHCSDDEMRIDLVISNSIVDKTKQIYLEGLKSYPDIKCQPNFNDTVAQFKLSLKDFYECGVTRMINKLTGKTVYYHKIIIEDGSKKESVSVKCITNTQVRYGRNETTDADRQQRNHAIVRRDVLPAGFQEPEDLDITTSFTERAPEPMLSVGVRLGNELVTGELNVSPGTPLSMEINLDKVSAPVYGLAVTYMQVTDTKSQEETIIFNGCSVDPYLFENFNTIDGDFLNAKFRAFKFPESTFVQFRATVNVCLDKCVGTPCSNGQIGYGRRKREARQSTDTNNNKIYEFSLATFIKVSDENENFGKDELLLLQEKLKQLKNANQKINRNSRGSNNNDVMMEQNSEAATVLAEEEVIIRKSGSQSTLIISNIILLLTVLLNMYATMN